MKGSALAWILGGAGALALAGGSILGLAAPAGAPVPESTFTHTAPTGDVEPAHIVGDGPRLSIPSIDAELGILTVAGVDGELVVPDPPEVGWFDQSAPLGATSGATIVAGHVDTRSGDLTALGKLAGIEPGATIHVRDDAGQVHAYQVTAVDLFDQGNIPAAMFATSGDPVLRVITCAGKLIGEPGTFNYEKNLVVTATKVDGGNL